MSDLWYKRVGFHDNPFSIKPAAFDHELVAYDMEFIYEKIDQAELVFIEGKYGTGKTTILKNIINNYRGRNKIIYYSFNRGDEFDAKKLLNGANSLLRRISGLKVKNIIMLLDEVHSMKQKEAKELLEFYKDGTIQSLIFVSHDYDEVKLPGDVETMLNGNVLKTIDLSFEEAKELVENRIGTIELIPDDLLEQIFDLANKNPRRFLEHVEDVCKYAVEIGDMQVSNFHMQEVFGDLLKKPKSPKTETKKEEVKKEETKKTKKEVVDEHEEKVTTKDDKSKTKEVAKSENNQVDKEISKIEEKVTEKKSEIVEKRESPKIEVKEVETATSVAQDDDGYLDLVELKAEVEKKPKKYKVNKLVSDTSQYGQVVQKEADDQIPEYKIYFMDD